MRTPTYTVCGAQLITQGSAENFSFAPVPGMARDNRPAEADVFAPALKRWTSN